MAHVTYDTSAIISYRVTDLPDNFLLSAVVITELIGGAGDDSERKRYEATRRVYEKDGTLIVPTSEDWSTASRILYWLAKGRKKKAGGKSPRLIAGATQRMAFDALLTVSARRAGAAIVTVNWDDFKAIQYYYKGVKLIRASDFFG